MTFTSPICWRVREPKQFSQHTHSWETYGGFSYITAPLISLSVSHPPPPAAPLSHLSSCVTPSPSAEFQHACACIWKSGDFLSRISARARSHVRVGTREGRRRLSDVRVRSQRFKPWLTGLWMLDGGFYDLVKTGYIIQSSIHLEREKEREREREGERLIKREKKGEPTGWVKF